LDLIFLDNRDNGFSQGSTSGPSGNGVFKIKN
jgi:hypothetical protein